VRQHEQQGAGSVAASPDQAVVEFDYEDLKYLFPAL
jgi:hypothetical protein